MSCRVYRTYIYIHLCITYMSHTCTYVYTYAAMHCADCDLVEHTQHSTTMPYSYVGTTLPYSSHSLPPPRRSTGIYDIHADLSTSSQTCRISMCKNAVRHHSGDRCLSSTDTWDVRRRAAYQVNGGNHAQTHARDQTANCHMYHSSRSSARTVTATAGSETRMRSHRRSQVNHYRPDVHGAQSLWILRFAQGRETRTSSEEGGRERRGEGRERGEKRAAKIPCVLR